MNTDNVQPEEPTMVQGQLYPCCMNRDNRYLREEEQRDDLKVERCRICERRHFTATMEPGKFKKMGASI